MKEEEKSKYLYLIILSLVGIIISIIFMILELLNDKESLIFWIIIFICNISSLIFCLCSYKKLGR